MATDTTTLPAHESLPGLSDEEALAKSAHLDDATILADIELTERELAQCRRCVDAYDVIAQNHLDMTERRMSDMRARAVQAGIERGERLLAHIKRIARLRGIGPSLCEEIMAREG